jgi:hypothetical protein
MPLTTYYPGQNDESHDDSIRIASILAMLKGAKVN